MTEHPRCSKAGFIRLALRQVPLMLRSFFRQRALTFWTYGFSLAALFIGCSVLAGGDVDEEFRAMVGCWVVTLTLIGSGVYGVNRGLWEFFGGAAVERYRRSPIGGSAVLSYCIARYVVTLSAVALQLLLLGVAYGVAIWRRIDVITVTAVLAVGALVGLGLFSTTVVRSRRQSVILSNFLFAALFIGMIPDAKNPPVWLATLIRVLPSRHTTHALETVLIGRGGFADVAGSLLFLLFCAAVVVAIAVFRFDWLAFDRGNPEASGLEG